MKKGHHPFVALKFRDFRIFVIGLFISSIGSQMQYVAINWQLYMLTKSPLSLGIMGLMRFLPMLALAPFAGLVADMFNRRKILLATQITLTVSSFVLGIASFSGHVTPGIIYVLLIINSIAVTFDIPARQSLYPLLVPKDYFIYATGLSNLLWQISIVLGPSLAGLVIAAVGVTDVYFVNAVSFVTIIAALLMMNLPPRSHERPTDFSISHIKDGFRFVFRQPVIRSTMLLDFFATFFASASTLMPIFANDILKVGPRGLGFLYAAPSVGSVIGGLSISIFHRVKKQGMILVNMVILYGLATILFGISRNFGFSLVFLAIAGFCDSISAIIRSTARQLLTPDHMRGRMSAVNMIFFWGGPELGEVEAGLAASLLGSPLSVILGGAFTMVITMVIAYFTPKIRSYQGNDVVTL